MRTMMPSKFTSRRRCVRYTDKLDVVEVEGATVGELLEQSDDEVSAG